jgi:hypothetical protein
VKPGVTRQLAVTELPPGPPGEYVIGFAYATEADRDRYAAANRARGHRVVEVTMPGGEPATFTFLRMPA